MHQAIKNNGFGGKVESNLKNLDLSIFDKAGTGCYKVNVDKLGNRIPYVPNGKDDDGAPITDRCAFTKRLCTASLYIGALSASSSIDSDSRKALLVEFVQKVYQSLLDDVAHLVKEHDGDILEIQREWTEQYGLAKCAVSECAKTQRHYGRNRVGDSGNANSDDAVYSFYRGIFDQIHHFIFHLFDVGLRVDTQAIANELMMMKNETGLVFELYFLNF